MVSDQDGPIYPKEISRFKHGMISGFILIFAGSVSSWLNNRFIDPLDPLENIFLVGVAPLLIYASAIAFSIWITNIYLSRTGYLPIRFLRGNRHINGESVAGCVSSLLLITGLIFVASVAFSLFQLNF